MEWFFTADHHFGHKNIIKYCNRPFVSIEEHDEILVQKWNEVVKQVDIVIVAGDFTLKRSVADEYISYLNGNKIFLKGNHDKWIKKKRYIYHKKINGKHIAVSHYPMESWQNSCQGSWHLHGHCHGTMRVIPNRLDIGVDCHNFYPVAFDQLDSLLIHGEATAECDELRLMGREVKEKKTMHKYMMATKAIHKLGDISSDFADLCFIHDETETDYIGNWITGFGFIDVKFPKETTRELTDEEIDKYNKLYYQISSQPAFQLKIKRGKNA